MLALLVNECQLARLAILPYNGDMVDKSSIQSVKDWLGNGSINIFGRPFAGKDTQGRILADLFDGSLIGGGEILRATSLDGQAARSMRDGHLIPSDDYVRIMLPYLQNNKFKDRPLILSAVGRWAGEEDGVMNALSAAGHPLKAVIWIQLDEDYVIDRWRALKEHDDRGGRHDDTLAILKTRLAEFNAKTVPVAETYRKAGLLLEVDGQKPPAQVTEAILQSLANTASRA